MYPSARCMSVKLRNIPNFCELFVVFLRPLKRKPKIQQRLGSCFMYSDLFIEIFTVKSKFYAFYTCDTSVLVFIRCHILTHVSIYTLGLFSM